MVEEWAAVLPPGPKGRKVSRVTALVAAGEVTALRTTSDGCAAPTKCSRERVELEGPAVIIIIIIIIVIIIVIVIVIVIVIIIIIIIIICNPKAKRPHRSAKLVDLRIVSPRREQLRPKTHPG